MTKPERNFWLLFLVSFFCLLASLTFIFFWIAPEASQGQVQKIFFFHVPAAFALYVGLFVGAGAAALHLFERKAIYDQIAEAAIYTALIFATVVIVSGPIWAKPIWGVYWTWDPRLTTTFSVFILLIAYAFVRSLFANDPGNRGPLVSGVIAVLALLDVPLIHFSVRLWRGIHPSVLKNADGLPDTYRQGLEFMTLAIFLLASLVFCLFLRWIKIRALWKALSAERMRRL